MCIWTRHFFILNAWGVLQEFLGGGELIGSQVLTLFQTRNPDLFSDLDFRQKYMSSIVRS